MSITYAYILPENEKYVPCKTEWKAILDAIKIRGKANLEVYLEQNDIIQFYDCGENFESISCPFCKSELDLEWWQDEMGKASEIGFSEIKLLTPCCNKNSSLNELKYDMPQGFAKFAIKIDDYEIEKLIINDSFFSELHGITGQPWKVIFARY
jgi:hypothetical protein